MNYFLKFAFFSFIAASLAKLVCFLFLKCPEYLLKSVLFSLIAASLTKLVCFLFLKGSAISFWKYTLGFFVAYVLIDALYMDEWKEGMKLLVNTKFYFWLKERWHVFWKRWFCLHNFHPDASSPFRRWICVKCGKKTFW